MSRRGNEAQDIIIAAAPGGLWKGLGCPSAWMTIPEAVADALGRLGRIRPGRVLIGARLILSHPYGMNYWRLLAPELEAGKGPRWRGWRCVAYGCEPPGSVGLALQQSDAAARALGLAPMAETEQAGVTG